MAARPRGRYGYASPYECGRATVEVVSPVQVGFALTRSIPSGQCERVKMVTAILTTSGAAGNRIPVFRFRDQDGNVLAEIPGLAVQAAGAIVRYTWLTGYGTSITNVGGDVVIPLPEIFLYPGWSWQFNISVNQAGDAFSSVFATSDVFRMDAELETEVY